MRFTLAVLLGVIAAADGFLVDQRRSFHGGRMMPLASGESDIDLGLTPELKKVTDAFSSISDDQLRYKQLLYMAQNTKEANDMPATSKIPENKVPGCLSTVYIDGTTEYSEEAGDYIINFIGDSDGLLTRGLVALLVR
jgi:sulfur transfer protein SufE